MLAATFFGVILACFAGEITCNEMKKIGKVYTGLQRRLNSTIRDMHQVSMYPCTSGNAGEASIQGKEYSNATVCVVFKDNVGAELDHVGVCFSGECLGHRERCPGCTESELQQRWSQLPELAAEFHRCPDLSESDPVENCLYVCKATHDNGKEGYFYGISKDNNPCKLTDGQKRDNLRTKKSRK
uniref:Putative secreted protein n=1 Tax=Ixodes ricinus TaxID=34613 RepID=A0A090X830_IXORI